jgi:S-(hydroxymethyl)mycothiol dehydrogenase
VTVGVLLNAPGEDARVEELEVDGPGPDEVQVRLEATGVCHSDLFVKESGGWGMPYPILLGHEGAGIVEQVGEGVERPSVGDRVVLAWRAPCGKCAPCRRGDPRRCRTPLRARRRLHRKSDGAVVTQTLLCGTFATRTIVHAGAAIPVPPELPVEQACLLGCAVATGVGAVLQTSPAWPGSTVAVIGCGGVGLSAVQGARLAGAARIIAVDVAAQKLDWARTFGAADVVDASKDDVVSAVRALNGDEGVDFAYDAVGRGETLEQAVRMLALGGTATLIGLPHDGASATVALGGNEGLFMRRGTIRVSHGGDHLPAEDIPQLAQYALEGKLDLAAMVTRTIGLDDVEQAFDDLMAGAVIRSVIQLPA